nr:hypothetical protein [Bacteroidota bacterium]
MNNLEVGSLSDDIPPHASLEAGCVFNKKSADHCINFVSGMEDIFLTEPEQKTTLQHLMDKITKAREEREQEFVVIEKVPVELGIELMKEYEGFYELAPGDNFEVKIIDGALNLIDRGQNTELLAEGDDMFFIKIPFEFIISFQREEGKIVSITLNMSGREMMAQRLTE